MKQIIFDKSLSLFDEVVAIRRKLHKYPELSFCEKETSSVIKDYLASKGIAFETDVAGYGVVATVVGTAALPGGATIALRADMDALPIKEENSFEYRSVNEGVMHACGHDAHTAMLLGAASIIHDLRGSFSGKIKFVFQPGEEKLPGGASLMLANGALKDVDFVVGQHVFPDLQCGCVGFHQGPFMASCDEVNIIIRGKGGHAAKPSERSNALLAAAEIVSRLSKMFPESDTVALRSDGLLCFGSLIADGTYNVVPPQVSMKGTMRTFNEKKRAAMKSIISALSHDTAALFGCSTDVFIENGYPSLINDNALTEKCRLLASEYLDPSKVLDIPQMMTADDFAFYSQAFPSCFYRIGVSNVSKGIDSKQHTSTFDIDEDALQIGTGLMSFIAISLCNNIILP
ncbi:MAG: M20 family metallopeptidase [Candidatus Limimorpha sp.]